MCFCRKEQLGLPLCRFKRGGRFAHSLAAGYNTTAPVRFIEAILSASEQERLVIERITSARFARAWILRRQFRDKPSISFTDLTSMAVMQESGLADILTEDGHFTQVGMGFTIVP